jgi:putative salt-induced outer membrane protein YdiY
VKLSLPTCILAAALGIPMAPPVLAQDPPAPADAPPAGWAGSLAAGLALTGGNTSTTTTNFAFTVESDKTRRNVFRAEGLNIRSSRDGEAIVDRTNLQVQDEYALTRRIYTFGRFQYLSDEFKAIDYLISPTGGLGYKFIDNPNSTLTADLAVGPAVEKNPGVDGRTTGALVAAQKAAHKLSTVATLTESLNVLWKTSDFGDSLLTFQAGLATDITPRTQLKVDFLDIFKSQPPSVEIKKNDTALIVAFVFKF